MVTLQELEEDLKDFNPKNNTLKEKQIKHNVSVKLIKKILVKLGINYKRSNYIVPRGRDKFGRFNSEPSNSSQVNTSEFMKNKPNNSINSNKINNNQENNINNTNNVKSNVKGRFDHLKKKNVIL